MLPIGLLALGIANHLSAATCNSSYTLAAVSAAGFSCSMGCLTFSNFNYQYLAGVTIGCGAVGEPACPPEAAVPDPTLDVAANFNTLTSGSDPLGTAASPSSPITQVITDYSGAAVGEFQTGMRVIQYLVTAFGGSQIA